MKKATFKYTDEKRNINLYGTVILKNDGKVSVSLPNGRYGTSAYERHQVKRLANDIVKANFIHGSIISFEEVKSDDKLIMELKDKTQELLKRFIKMTKESAKRQFQYMEEWKNKSDKDWMDRFGVKCEYRKLNAHFEEKIYWMPVSYDKTYYKMKNRKEYESKVLKKGYEEFEAEEVKYAERHYDDSIAKLAYRLNQKGITNGSQFTITNEWIGINLHLTIEHGKDVTNAWTIIAEGQIQRAHYRYLIK